MSEYIFVTNIFEYSNIRIYSSHSGGITSHERISDDDESDNDDNCESDLTGTVTVTGDDNDDIDYDLTGTVCRAA